MDSMQFRFYIKPKKNKLYEIILGMNWLSTYHAFVDYYKERMIFKIDEVLKFLFE